MKKHYLLRAPTVSKGPVKHSKRVRDRIKATNSLLSAIEGFKDAATAGYRAKLEAELRDGEALPDQGLALALAGRSVKTAIDLLVKADDVYCRHALDRRLLNDACHHVARDVVYPELVAVRKEIDHRFGREAGRGVHGIEGATLRKPRRLQPQVDYVVRVLAKRKQMPKPKRPGPPGERQDWLARLEPGSKKLTELLRELDHGELREAMRRRDRDFELEAFDAVYAEALGYVRSVYQIAGLDTGWIWSLLPTVQRRRLKGKARRESEARADGRRSGPASGE